MNSQLNISDLLKVMLLVLTLYFISCDTGTRESKENVSYTVDKLHVEVRIDTNIKKLPNMYGTWLESKRFLESDSLWTYLKPVSNDIIRMDFDSSCYSTYVCNLDGEIKSIIDSTKHWFYNEQPLVLSLSRVDCNIEINVGDSVIVNDYRIAYADEKTLSFFGKNNEGKTIITEYIKVNPRNLDE